MTDAWTGVAESSVLGERLAVHRTARSPDGLPAMVLIHGLEDDWRTWSPFAERLSAHYRCYALDLPWRTGGDHGWRKSGTATRWVEAALALIPERITVITAHSMGANQVLRWLANGARPEVAALVLVSPLYLPSSRAVGWRTFERAVADFRVMMGEGLRVRLGARAESMDPELLDIMAIKVLDRIGPAGFFAGFEEYLSATGLALGEVRIPTLLIAGEGDPGLTGGGAEVLAADIPAAELNLRPDLTHFCHAEQPELTAELALSFLKRREDPP